ncbi:MAG: uroporphyrinogen decarboxylase [Treponema sp.]|jgi:uroporphyrinogen-III decarboxylase|nr:uroporphyrinogen decarboxylase [Treponema sp.]
MLTRRQNLLETIGGGKPDRFVKQYEALWLLMGDNFAVGNPIGAASASPAPGGEAVNAWGVTVRWREGQPGPFPVHDDVHKVVKDVTRWKDVVKMPETGYPDEAWEPYIKNAEAVDKNEYFLTVPFFTGIFEQCHYLMGIDDCLAAFYEEPEAMHEMVDYISEYELKYAEEVTKYLKPDALFHHDDWGTQNSSFISPDMFNEFFLPAYRKIYGYYKSRGIEIIVHHSDSYAANLVPQMIEMGIDIFQGCITSNNVPELVKKYGGKISFMGDLNNGVLDKGDWTRELVRAEVERACRSNGKRYYIPCLTMGGPGSTFPGVYEAVDEEIDRMSREMF